MAHSVGDDELTPALCLAYELGTCTCRDQSDETDEMREDVHVVGSLLNRRAVAEAGPLCETSFHSAALIPVTLPGHLLCAVSRFRGPQARTLAQRLQPLPVEVGAERFAPRCFAEPSG
jgi:hypothetical protein